MAKVKFKINNRIEVISEEEIYSCNLQDIKDDKLALSIPIKGNEYLPLRKGERVEALYYDKGCIYRFSSWVHSREKANISLIWINRPHQIKRIQRRRFVRTVVFYEIKYAIVDKNLQIKKDSLKNFKFYDGIILDLSGGGVKLTTETELKKDDVILIILPLNDENMIVKGEIKRSYKDDAGKDVFGVSFIDLKVTDQDKIVKHVFQVMREQMRKGLREG